MELRSYWQKWSLVSMQQLMQECKMQRINSDKVPRSEELLSRLVLHHAWEQMSDDQLQDACFARGVPVPKSSFSSAYSVNREADRTDIIFRLKEAVFGLRPGEFGPLPVAPDDAKRPSGYAPKFAPKPAPKTAPKPPPKTAPKTAPDGSDDWKSEPRMFRFLQEFPGFSGPAPGPEAAFWTDAALYAAHPAMMKLCLLLPALAGAAKVLSRRDKNPCPNNLENRFPSTLDASYNISQDHGLNPLDAIWDTEKLREAMTKDSEWKIGMHWVLKATFYSDSTVDRTMGFAGSKGGFLTITVPAGAQGFTKSVAGAVGQAADKLEFQYLAPGNWTSGEVYMTDICLTPQSCDNYQCPSHSKLKGEGIFGHSEARCCVKRLCQEEKVVCPEGKYTPHENFTKGKPGHNVETCCVPNLCPPKLCENETKWKDRGDVGLMGSTPEDCCEERLCANHACGEPGQSKKLDIWESPGVARKGSTDAECCEPLYCKDFECKPEGSYALRPDAANLKGSDRATCCDVVKCDTFECPNNTKCLACNKYTCSKDSLQKLVNPGNRLGSTDEECCEEKSCKDWKCSDSTKWVHRADQVALTNTDRKGWSDEECCDRLLCLPEICDPSSQWKPKENDGTLQGSTFEQCCEKIYCEDFVCDTDLNKTGVGTQWYKKVDTNTYKWQGSTNEECCLQIYCSQYTTNHDTRWKRKEDPSLLGSTDVECYDPRWCSDYCCADENKVLMPNAEKHQGSTDTEGRLSAHFRTLGLSDTASAEAVRKAYRALALKHHPDKSEDKSGVDFQRVQQAYDALAQGRLRPEPSE
ncbi:unnamed protein product [Effrenium voratum]|nr:unnamed protein product [Effrenium voratum]